MSSHARLTLSLSRSVAMATAVVFAAGGIPGEGVRPVFYDAAPSPVPVVVDRDGSVEVTVHAGAAGPPLAGARVQAFALLEDRAYLADARETDREGRALFVRLPHAVTWLVADAPGRARGSTHLFVDADARHISIDLDPEHTFEVVVKDETGGPVADAPLEVLASADPLPVGTRTLANGVAHVSRVGAGPWRLTVRAPGYEEAIGRAEHDGDEVLITLRVLGTLSVHVVAEGDAPVAGARVLVAGAMLWPARSTETDANGDARIGGLSAGAYALRASRGDLVSPIELGVPLARGEHRSVVLKVASGRWISVRIADGEDDEAAGIPNARVTLAEGGLSPFPLEATTDPKGRARLGPIAPGLATVSARADGFVPRGGLALADRPATETRIVLVRAGTLGGRVLDARGFPIDGATIEIVGTDTSGAPIFDDPGRASFQAAHFEAMLGGPAPLVATGELGVVPGPVPAIPRSMAFTGPLASRMSPDEPWVTRSDGTFRAAPVSPGRIRAVVHHPQYVQTESASVTLTPGGEAHVDVVMLAGGALEGRVVDARDRPAPGARVLVSATRGTIERATRSASDGTFAFAALPETVTVTASTDDDDQPDARLAVSIPEGGRREVTVRLPQPRGALDVKVVDDRDWPIEAAQVSASSLSPDSPLRATAFTDAQGGASLKRARGLALRIEAFAPGRAPRVVLADPRADEVRIELSPAETATGTVVAAQGGDPVVGAEVTIHTEVGVRRTRTDGRGAFNLDQLSPGASRLRVRAPGFAAVLRPTSIPDSQGRRTFVMPAVELVSEGVVEGDVLDVRGGPVAGARVGKDQAPTWRTAGTGADGAAVADAKGRFSLRELAEGTVTLEAYAPDFGRARVEGVKVVAGQTTADVHIVMDAAAPEKEPAERQSEAAGNVAITLGETGDPTAVVVTSVAAGSEAERAGVAPGDLLLAVDDVPVNALSEARDRLGGPLSSDVIVKLKRGEREELVTIAREAVRR